MPSIKSFFTGRYPRRKSRGQNLVELALTLPFVLVLLFFIIELGRAWFVYEGAKMAAMDGVHSASVFHNAQVGQQQLNAKLAAAGLTVVNAQVAQVPNRHAYQASVTVTFRPFFGNLSIPTVSGPIQIMPNQFNISYTAVEDISVY